MERASPEACSVTTMRLDVVADDSSGDPILSEAHDAQGLDAQLLSTDGPPPGRAIQTLGLALGVAPRLIGRGPGLTISIRPRPRGRPKGAGTRGHTPGTTKPRMLAHRGFYKS